MKLHINFVLLFWVQRTSKYGYSRVCIEILGIYNY